MKLWQLDKKDRLPIDVYLDIIEKEIDREELDNFDMDYLKIRMDIVKNYCNEIINICDRVKREYGDDDDD